MLLFEKMTRILPFIVFFFICFCVVICANSNYRVCVPHNDTAACSEMEIAVASTDYKFTCVYGRDKIDCMRKVKNKEADLLNLAANEAYVASLNFSLIPFVQEERNRKNDGVMYEAVAVVRKSSQIKSLNDLKGKRSCHTGYGRNAGWTIPISILRAAPGVMGPECGELDAVSSFFLQSCVPGNWSLDRVVDSSLKTSFPNLCTICKAKCQGNGEDSYLGYEGALLCLTETQADVAFTKLSVAVAYFRSESNRDYEYLCPNGSTVPLSTQQPCHWSSRPNNVIVARDDESVEGIRSAVSQTFSHFTSQQPSWLEKTLISNNSITSLSIEQGTMMSVLEKHDYSVTIVKPLPPNCHENYTRVCVKSQLEHEKCNDFKLAAFAQGLRPQVECHLADSAKGCVSDIRSGKADITVLSISDAFVGYRSTGHKVMPLLNELYGQQDFAYYAVAVVKQGSNITSLKDLKGHKACFGGFDNIVGWNVPVGKLKRPVTDLANPPTSLISGGAGACSLVESVAAFFGQSCAPGVKDRSSSLCKLCVGDEKSENNCSGSSEERYFGSAGAFRCLVEGGDVAFVKHTTVLDYTDGRSDAPWASHLAPLDFKLLCLDGKLSDVSDYEACNWAKIPSRQVVYHSDASVRDIKMMLTKAASAFGPNKDLFKLFGKFNDTKDLVFKDSATGLKSSTATSKVIYNKDLDEIFDSTLCYEVTSGSSRNMIFTSLLAFCMGFLLFERSMWLYMF